MSKIEVNQISSQCGSTLTIGQSGDTIQLACGATQTGFGRTGTVDWDTTAKTASFTAVSGNGYFVNTTSSAITVTLPAGSAGDIVGISDYASTFQTNNVTIAPNGSDNINGINENATLSTQGLAVSLVYVDSTRGWKSVTGSDNDTTGTLPFIQATGGTITTCGDFKIHTFTGPGTFTVSSSSPCSTNNTFDYLVVAGGGSGGGDRGGGGGGGGFRYFLNTTSAPTACAPGAPLNGYGSPTPSGTAITASIQSYPITVGGGGAASSGGQRGNQGSSSIFSTVTSAGGGSGGGCQGSPTPGGNGGSGGGARDSAGATAGSGNTPPVTPSQGQDGGASPASNNRAAGGGGAIAAGGVGAPGGDGAGGNGAGIPTKLAGSAGETCGSFQFFSGGGEGGSNSTGSTGGGGLGGGGDRGPGQSGVGGAGTANTGGGSGIVIIRYKYQ